MHAFRIRTARLVLAALALGSSCCAFAGGELMGVDSQHRARIAKEKIRMAAQERKNEEQDKTSPDQGSSSCGSQSIGNIDTGGRPGTSPRDVFVFAPNAINIVGRGGCR